MTSCLVTFEHNTYFYFYSISPTGICPVGLILWKARHESLWLVGSSWVQLSLEAEKCFLPSKSNSLYIYFFINFTFSQVTNQITVEPVNLVTNRPYKATKIWPYYRVGYIIERFFGRKDMVIHFGPTTFYLVLSWPE